MHGSCASQALLQMEHAALVPCAGCKIPPPPRQATTPEDSENSLIRLPSNSTISQMYINARVLLAVFLLLPDTLQGMSMVNER
jgi:hypothetical protein